MIDGLVTRFPELTAIALIVVGFVLAAMFSWLTGKILGWLTSTLDNLIPSTSIVASNNTRILLQRIVYYLTIAMFVLMALQLLGFEGLADFLDPAIGWIPGLLSGAAIILIGYLLGDFVHQILLNSFWSGGSPLVPRLAQVTIVIIATLTGLSQMAIDVSLIGQLLIGFLLVTLGGLSLAFAIGSSSYVANLLARRSFNDFAVGDRIRMKELEGSILEFTPTSVLVRTDQGVAVIPAREFSESIVIRLTS